MPFADVENDFEGIKENFNAIVPVLPFAPNFNIMYFT